MKILNIAKTVVLWALSVFLLIFALALMPQSGLSFLLLAICAAGCNPLVLQMLQKRNKKPPKKVLIPLLAVLFIVSMIVYPSATIDAASSGETNAAAGAATSSSPINSSSSAPTEVSLPATSEIAEPVSEEMIPEAPVPVPTEMKVHFIDVGQGDSILVESDHHYLLIDAGTNESGSTVVKYLKDQKISTLDYVIGTHPHEDHIGGLDQVINSFQIQTIIMPPKEHTTKTFEDVLDAIAAKGLKITQNARKAHPL